MVFFFRSATAFLAVNAQTAISKNDIEKLCWLFGNASYIDTDSIEGTFVGPRQEMITPWSTNAVEITQTWE
jgi:phosphoribosylformylglycinamidine synthase